jgi:hypothetical protein
MRSSDRIIAMSELSLPVLPVPKLPNSAIRGAPLVAAACFDQRRSPTPAASPTRCSKPARRGRDQWSATDMVVRRSWGQRPDAENHADCFKKHADGAFGLHPGGHDAGES